MAGDAAVSIYPKSRPQPYFPNVMNHFGRLFNFLSYAFCTPLLTMSPRPSVVATQPVKESSTLSMKVMKVISYPASFKEAFLDWKDMFLIAEIEPDDPEYPVRNR